MMYFNIKIITFQRIVLYIPMIIFIQITETEKLLDIISNANIWANLTTTAPTTC